METLYERGAGLDVHKDTVVAGVRMATGRSAQRGVKTFATTTSGLLELHDWLQSGAVTHGAMEATGVYWKPVWRLRGGSFQLILANASHTEWREALRGRVTKHHRFMLKLHLRQIDQLDCSIEQLEAQAREATAPFRHQVEQLTAIPGVGETAASVLLAEIGTDMSVFPSAAHLLSWAGMCPRSDESAGKRRSTRLRHGAPWLKATLVQIAWPAIRRKDSYFRALFHRLKARRGPKKAIGAFAASILTTAYPVLRDAPPSQDLGPPPL